MFTKRYICGSRKFVRNRTSEITSLSPLPPCESKNAKFHGPLHAEIMVNAASQKRTELYRSEECNIRLKEICYQRDCERIVILANQESILANYRKGRAEPVRYTGCSRLVTLLSSY